MPETLIFDALLAATFWLDSTLTLLTAYPISLFQELELFLYPLIVIFALLSSACETYSLDFNYLFSC